MIPALLSAILATSAQAVGPLVANFISNFSLAATEVELKPDAHGNYLKRDRLATTVLTMRGVPDSTIQQAFVLLDKNPSKQRLIVGDLLLILIYKVPANTPAGDLAVLRYALSPTSAGKPDSAKWPWQKDATATWKLESFEVEQGRPDLSLLDRLSAFKGFKRE